MASHKAMPALNKNNSGKNHLPNRLDEALPVARHLAVKRIMQEARELANDPCTDYSAAPLEVVLCLLYTTAHLMDQFL